MVFNPQTFGKLDSANGEKICEGSRAIHVPLKFQAPISAAGARIYQGTLDLTTFLRGMPSPFVSGLQTLIVYQNSKDSSGNLVNDSFITELLFNNGFKCAVPGRAYTAISVICDNAPTAILNIYTQNALLVATNVEIDLYFANFEIDQTHFKVM